MISKYIDHTLLKATASEVDIKMLCEEAITNDFMSVCVNPSHVEYAKNLLSGSNVLVCTVIGFPLGANSSSTKVFETINAISNGADEIDMVINIGRAKTHDYEYITKEIADIVHAANGNTVKVILETCYLSNDEIKKLCECAVNAGANFVKTSTGFGTAGATVEHVKLMKSVVGDKLGVKASGGIRTIDVFNEMISAGATRIGTSSGVIIVAGSSEAKNDTNSSY
jgi:deoxyribose-phosphate aldolase